MEFRLDNKRLGAERALSDGRTPAIRRIRANPRAIPPALTTKRLACREARREQA